MAPVQGYAAGIPWAMHLRAYDAYCKRYGKQQALIEGSCRGGFGVCELDEFIPGWREELDERSQLRKRVETLELRITEAIQSLDSLADLLSDSTELRVKEVDSIARLNQIINQLGVSP